MNEKWLVQNQAGRGMTLRYAVDTRCKLQVNTSPGRIGFKTAQKKS
jgi:hypothetical protein